MASASDTQYDETRPETILQNVLSNFQNGKQKDQSVTCSKWSSCVLAARHVQTTTETHHICLNKTKETEIWDPGRWWKQKFNRTADAHVSNTLMLLPLQKLLRIKNVIQVFEGSKQKKQTGSTLSCTHRFWKLLLKSSSAAKLSTTHVCPTCIDLCQYEDRIRKKTNTWQNTSELSRISATSAKLGKCSYGT